MRSIKYAFPRLLLALATFSATVPSFADHLADGLEQPSKLTIGSKSTGAFDPGLTPSPSSVFLTGNTTKSPSGAAADCDPSGPNPTPEPDCSIPRIAYEVGGVTGTPGNATVASANFEQSAMVTGSNAAPEDLGTWVAAAFAQCQAGTQSSCKVELLANQVYTYGKTITIPALARSGDIGGYPILEGNGATLVYTGTADAIYVAPRYNFRTMTGAIRNLTITTTNASATPLHTQSIIGFRVENVALLGTGTNAACLKMENTPLNGLGLWTEWNTFVITTRGCVKGVQLRNEGGQPSFLYNDWQIFSRVEADQIGFSIEGAIGTPGSRLIMGANTYGKSGHLAHVISASGGAQGSFAQLILHGESDNNVVDCSTFVDSTSFISGGLGSQTGANWIPCNEGVSSQVEINSNINPGYTNLQGHTDTGAEFQAGFYSRNYPQKANCKTSFLGGSTPGDNASMAFGLADPAGFSGPNCYFEIYKRVTSDTDPEVNIPGASGNPILNSLFVDSYSGGVGIGPGFGWNGSNFTLPEAALHLNGDALFQSTSADAYAAPITLLAPQNNIAGHVTYSRLGTDTTHCNDTLATEFMFEGNGSTSNYGGLGIACRDFIINWHPNGHVSIGTTSDAGASLGVIGGTNSDFYTGPAEAPKGSCSTVGWVFSQDGHATFCNGSEWVPKI